MRPVTDRIYWNELGRLMKMWKAFRISDARALKLMRLYIGYDLTDLMDGEGRYPGSQLNELRRRLGYTTVYKLMADVIASKAFFVVGNSDRDVRAVFSPLWHRYVQEDGGTVCTPESHRY